jgi:hypothetical protein
MIFKETYFDKIDHRKARAFNLKFRRKCLMTRAEKAIAEEKLLREEMRVIHDNETS